MAAILSGAFGPGACITLVILALLATAILFYLIPEITKYSKVNKLNSSRIRDKRFATGLLSVYFKKNIVENPYLLRTDKDCRPDADLLIICEGGIIVLSVEDREGYFETPKKGIWTLRNSEEVKRIPNLFERGLHYANACANIAKRNGIACPIFNLVLLSDDNAEYDEASGDGILTNDMLVSCIKSIKNKQKISSEEVARLVELFKQNDSHCRKLFVESAFDDGFINKSEPAPVIEDPTAIPDGDDVEPTATDDDGDDGDINW